MRGSRMGDVAQGGMGTKHKGTAREFKKASQVKGQRCEARIASWFGCEQANGGGIQLTADVTGSGATDGCKSKAEGASGTRQ